MPALTSVMATTTIAMVPQMRISTLIPIPATAEAAIQRVATPTVWRLVTREAASFLLAMRDTETATATIPTAVKWISHPLKTTAVHAAMCATQATPVVSVPMVIAVSFLVTLVTKTVTQA
jgi:hypothetical protein